MKLYDLPSRMPEGERPKIFNFMLEYPDGWIEFDHLDGMYSYCVAYDAKGEKLGVVHLAGFTPLVPCDGGFEVATDEEHDRRWQPPGGGV